MPQEEIKTFKVGDNVADVPLSQSEGFLKAYPDAIEVKSFTVGKDTADVPLDDIDGFMKSYPDAKPLSMGKPSAEPSKSTSGKSQSGGGEFGFNQTVGIKQPKSTAQPSIPSRASTEFGFNKTIKAEKPKPSVIAERQTLTPEVEQSLLPKEEPKPLNEGNIFSAFEQTQSYFSKVDKAKKEIVDNSNFDYNLPMNDEGKQIYLDATNSKSYESQKRKANAVQKAMSETLSPIIENDITADFLLKNDDGFLVPDPDKIDNYAKSVARKYGLPDDGFFKEVVYNEAKAMAAYRDMEPEIIDIFSKSSSGLVEEKSKSLWKGFTTDEIEQTELDKKVDVLAADLKVKSKQEQDIIEQNLSKKVEENDALYNQFDAQIRLKADNFKKEFDAGQLSEQDYKAAINNLNQISKQEFDAYSDNKLKLFDEGQKAANQISSKYNAQLRRQAQEF